MVTITFLNAQFFSNVFCFFYGRGGIGTYCRGRNSSFQNSRNCIAQYFFADETSPLAYYDETIPEDSGDEEAKLTRTLSTADVNDIFTPKKPKYRGNTSKENSESKSLIGIYLILFSCSCKIDSLLFDLQGAVVKKRTLNYAEG